MSECWSEKPEERPTFKWICSADNRLIKDTKVEKAIVPFNSLSPLESKCQVDVSQRK